VPSSVFYRRLSSGLLCHVAFRLYASVSVEHREEDFNTEEAGTVFIQNVAHSLSAARCYYPESHYAYLCNCERIRSYTSCSVTIHIACFDLVNSSRVIECLFPSHFGHC
jgi:hypothetical protein